VLPEIPNWRSSENSLKMVTGAEKVLPWSVDLATKIPGLSKNLLSQATTTVSPKIPILGLLPLPFESLTFVEKVFPLSLDLATKTSVVPKFTSYSYSNQATMTVLPEIPILRESWITDFCAGFRFERLFMGKKVSPASLELARKRSLGG
jgi:hypothetical protein